MIFLKQASFDQVILLIMALNIPVVWYLFSPVESHDIHIFKSLKQSWVSLASYQGVEGDLDQVGVEGDLHQVVLALL